MTRLAKKLKNRVSILQPTQIPNSIGGFTRGYRKIAEVWSELIPIATASQNIAYFTATIRGVQVNEIATHKWKVRRVAVEEIGSSFSGGFNRGFARSGSLQILRSEYYVFEPRGGTDGSFAGGFDTGFEQTEGLVGNLYRILGGVDNNSDREYLEVRIREVEEQGTGASA